jgi:ribosomal-protein-alanine N-acetyltransferase
MPPPPSFPTLKTERLLLREITSQDAPALFTIHGNPELMRWFGTDPLPDLASADGLVNTFAGWRTQANPGTRWGIQVQNEPKLIGTCGLFSWNRSWRKCTIGYELAPEAHSQGHMREALMAMLSWGFANMELNRVEAQIHPENLASIKLVQKLGFVVEGRLRQVGRWGGQFHDMLQFSLLRGEWKPTNAET